MGGGECFQFVVHVVKGKWFTVFASLLIMAGAGATYIYGIYSKQIQKTLGYDEDAMNKITLYRDVGANVAIFAGLTAEVVPTWVVTLIGAAMNFGGYFMIWRAVTGKIAKPKVWHMCAYIAIGTNSQNFANTAALVTCVKNFPESRGVVLGLMKGLVGLSGAILTQIFLGMYEDDLNSLILLIGWLPAVVSVVFVFTLRTMKTERQPNELKVFLLFFYSTIVLAFYLMIMTLLEKYVTMGNAVHSKSAIVVTVLLFLPLYIVFNEERTLWKYKKERENPPSEMTIEKSEDSEPKQLAEEPKGSCFANIFNKPERGEDHGILQAILSVDMLFIFVISLCGYGTSLTAIDQFGRIGKAQGYSDRLVGSIITLVSIWNYYGRVYSGFVSELLLKKYKLPRSTMMTVVLFMSGIGMLFVAFPEIPFAFYVASVLIGFSFGAQVPLNLAMISEFFGLKYYSTLFNCAQLISPLGSFLLNAKLTKSLYLKEATKDLIAKGVDTSSVKDPTCIGHHCFRLSFSILAMVAFFGAFAALILSKRTKEFYEGDIYRKYRVEEDEAYKRYKGETYMMFREDSKAN